MEYLDFSSVITTIRKYISDAHSMNQIDMMYQLFVSFLSSDESQDFDFDNGLVCRWFNGQAKINPRITKYYMDNLPEIATIFHVTTDYLLGVKGEPKIAKLLTTKETFQVNSKTEAETMVMNFQKETFPKLLSYNISEEDGNVMLVVEKEFGAEFVKMKFN